MNIQEVSNPGYEQQQPGAKSRKGWFACGAIGCLVMFLVCGGAIAFLAVIGVGASQTIEQARSTVQESQVVKDALGEPVTFKNVTPEWTVGQEGEVEFEFPVEGPDGEGIAYIRMKQVSLTQFDNVGIEFKAKGSEEKIDIMNSNELELDIEDVGLEDDFDDVGAEEPEVDEGETEGSE